MNPVLAKARRGWRVRRSLGTRLGTRDDLCVLPLIDVSVQGTKKALISRAFVDGETRTRTGDTTIFSRVLYQLSYLAVGEKG